MTRTNLLALTTALFIAACATTAGAPAPSRYEADEKLVNAHLATFDDLDYNVFTHQKWEDLHRSHAGDITVHWPDGRVTHGIEAHIDDLKKMFVFAPDTRILQHPIKIGQGSWTAVVGVMEGTFTEPMPIGDGKSIPPTGKAYKIQMATISHWTAAGNMDEEHLFWDNAEFMKQLGLGK